MSIHRRRRLELVALLLVLVSMTGCRAWWNQWRAEGRCKDQTLEMGKTYTVGGCRFTFVEANGRRKQEPGEDPKWSAYVEAEVSTGGTNKNRGFCAMTTSMYVGAPDDHDIEMWNEGLSSPDDRLSKDGSSAGFPKLSIVKKKLSTWLRATSGAEVGAVYAWIQDKKSYETECFLVPVKFQRGPTKLVGVVKITMDPCKPQTDEDKARGVTYGWDSMDHCGEASDPKDQAPDPDIRMSGGARVRYATRCKKNTYTCEREFVYTEDQTSFEIEVEDKDALLDDSAGKVRCSFGQTCKTGKGATIEVLRKR